MRRVVKETEDKTNDLDTFHRLRFATGGILKQCLTVGPYIDVSFLYLGNRRRQGVPKRALFDLGTTTDELLPKPVC